MSGMIIGDDQGSLPLNLDFVFEAGAYTVGAAPLLLAAGVKRIVDDCVSKSVEHRERRKAELQEWRVLQERQRQANAQAAALEEALVASEQRLAALELGAAEKRAAEPCQEAPIHLLASAQMRLAVQRLAPKDAAALLDELGKMFQTAPAAFRTAAGDPWGMLERQRLTMAGRAVGGEGVEAGDIAGLREAYHRTLAAFAASVRARRDWQEAMRRRIEAALDTVLFAEHVIYRFDAEMAVHAAELETLRGRLTALCTAAEASGEELGLIERRLETLRGEIDRDTISAAQRRGVAEAVTRILGEMGYESIDDFAFERDTPMALASMRIPGGEIVRAALHRKRQLAFEVVHERPFGAGAEDPLTTPERIHLQRQEQKWCVDAREMFRRLLEEGFQYRVAFEKELKADQVKVVVVESAGDVLGIEAEMDAEVPQQRRMDN
jgi:hypothetical protein